MISVVEIYEDVQDTINKNEGGHLSTAMFNRFSKKAELRTIDFLSGDVSGEKPPFPWLTQKGKDLLSPFIVKYAAQASGGIITRPENYYQYENMYRIGSTVITDCDDGAEDDDEVPQGDCNTVIELLDGQQFYRRCNTYIEGLKPSFDKPIAKMVGSTFEFMPQDLGSITLEYIRYPVYGVLRMVMDTIYNEEVPDANTSTNYEWDDWAAEALSFFISDRFFNHTREQAGKEFNAATGKLIRG